MIRTLAEAVSRVGGRLVGGDVPFASVGTDSRRDCSGQLFVALRGERFDAHDYLSQAVTQGAAAVLVDHPVEVPVPQWILSDTRIALGQLAAAWRDDFAGRVIAVTGSNGKTTCKEMIAAVLGGAGAVRATSGNLNNDIGMPLTLLSARDEDFLVLEIGANHPGEIGYLTDIARPDVAVITNAGRAHLEGFGSLEGVALAKGEIARGLSPSGVFIVPSDSPWTGLWHGLAAGHRVLSFGFDPAADVRAPADSVSSGWDDGGFRTCFQVSTGDRQLEIELALAGLHNVHNALVAVAVGSACGIADEAVRGGLARLAPVAGRLQPRRAGSGLRLIDDSYNANPDSLLAAIDVLVGLPGRRALVLGDLAELGPEAAALHREIGVKAKQTGVDALFAVGELSAAAVEGFGDRGRCFGDQGELIAALQDGLGPQDVVLVKGSRLAAMDRVADALCAQVDA